MAKSSVFSIGGRPASRTRAKRRVFEELPDEIRRSLMNPDIEHPHDAGVVQRGRGPGFLFEPAESILVGSERLRKHFHGDDPRELRIASAINAPHATLAEQSENLVATDLSRSLINVDSRVACSTLFGRSNPVATIFGCTRGKIAQSGRRLTVFRGEQRVWFRSPRSAVREEPSPPDYRLRLAAADWRVDFRIVSPCQFCRVFWRDVRFPADFRGAWNSHLLGRP